MFTVRQMRYFEALAATLHFRKAAQLAHVSQPALSAQIAEMEALAGAPLFERSQRQVIMTELGKQLYPGIQTILRELHTLEEIAAQSRGLLQTRLRLGIIPTVAPYLVPVLIPLLRERHPSFRLQLRESVTAKLLDELHAGEIDAIVAALPIDDERLAQRKLFDDRFLIATSTNDQTVLASPMTQDNVALDRLLLLEEGHCMRDQALAVCSLPSQRQLVKYGATSMTTLLQMVSHGMGLTLIPEIAVRAEARSNHMRIVPFDGEQPKREIALFWRRQSMRRKDFQALGDCIVESANGLLIDPKELETLAK
ncbi:MULTISPECIES: hydrogen peroxide-inducible genes activator [Brucella/Ochrobactrum group]|uniref:Transcriptional regulator, LysR family n=1 Tax=Brucella anthropi (strain ATCC 49188 / DSM 6882 / CCUG 24695 / JCM 21032 / LMG 3331 / NBRC 15819 / NCTC 12168 / Alc 37) TaxID=439375 RepID=A6X3F7_BRUA4|nr:MULTISPECIES: hydrogen peroxide-inducible genes activator [Brucella/Ochrobactrum group]ABS15761.1 transcriptional regulator, LysR family [Brucella anthropi ATCC 49188]KAB2735477.1 hydrogen peroxide-inducible genes activator [Brucella anthropi]KAB2751313.1 hydrogen peroxide-inducible genes activator [Brucella anthropi]KAB2761909.1 hydrogen peroxide-inducible genes activator [Brucella anthropi]KAB2777399.1 hydrogen peroxide-inducible genes activator [Brucella anthropi]